MVPYNDLFSITHLTNNKTAADTNSLCTITTNYGHLASRPETEKSGQMDFV